MSAIGTHETNIQSSGFRVLCLPNGIMLPIGGAETSVRHRFFGQLTEQAAGLPSLITWSAGTEAPRAVEKLIAWAIRAGFLRH